MTSRLKELGIEWTDVESGAVDEREKEREQRVRKLQRESRRDRDEGRG
jgi:hypothetical protein